MVKPACTAQGVACIEYFESSKSPDIINRLTIFVLQAISEPPHNFVDTN